MVHNLFGLLVTFSMFSCCVIIVVMQMSVFSLLMETSYNDEIFETSPFYGENLHADEQYHADNVQSFKSRKLKEFEYKEKLRQLSDAELKNLSHTYHRNISIQWGERGLLPFSKPLYDIQCMDYMDIDYGVKVSIVITFHDEIIPMLLRTLTTLVHRTSPKYLKEIILIDDFGFQNNSAEILQYCREQRIPVKLIHNEEQLGIANSRIKGMKMATGDVIAILDSHMEVMDLWLEPLLSIITEYPNAIAVPCIQMINEVEYDKLAEKLCQHYIIKMQNGFGILQFGKPSYPKDFVKTDPYPSSAMLGGALIAYKSTLLEFYPKSVISKTWGVENNRLSIRTWLCGDGIWMTTCSQVLHANGNDVSLLRYKEPGKDLFSMLVTESLSEIINYIPTQKGKDKVIGKFTINEEYIKLIYQNAEDIKKNFDPVEKDCKKYSYYSDQVIEEYLSFEQDQFLYVGEVQNVYYERMCIDIAHHKVGYYTCRAHSPKVNGNHIIGFTKNHGVRPGNMPDQCWDTVTYEENTSISLYGCHTPSPVEGKHADSQIFVYDNNTRHISHPPSKRCVTLDQKGILLKQCSDKDETQQWNIKMSPWF